MIVLDTHAVVWWAADPDRIPAKARRQIGAALKQGELLSVSSISTYEIARLAARGRLTLSIPAEVWITHLEAVPYFRFVPVDNALALRAAQLEAFDHGDPADRLILATAMELGATLITADTRLRGYAPVKAIWD